MPTPAQSKSRWFRFVALLSPVLILGSIELALRLTGYGYPTAFFLKARLNGQPVLVQNPKFGWRFFPPSLARSPQPLCVEAHKPPGTLRIFVFGESAAMGDPEPAYGFARQLERMLQARHPEKRVEVLNVAMTAINSHVMREIARDCAPLEGDCWIVYAGNNEVVGPFGAGTVFGRQSPSLAAVRANLALKSSRLGQLLSACLKRPGQPQEWEGMEMFLRQQVRCDDPRLQTVYDHFERNLAATIETGRRAGARVIIATAAVNLEDCPPFASAHRAGLSSSDLREWDKQFAAGVQSEGAGRFVDALSEYREAAEIDPVFAELVFRRAACEAARNQVAAARNDFARARDLDVLRFRADSVINQVIRRVAAAKHISLVDAEKECNRQGSGAASDEDLFYDHVHLSFEGNHALASLFFRAVERELFSAGVAEPMPELELRKRLAFTLFDQRRVTEEMWLRLRQPPFVSQSNFQARDERWRLALAALAGPPAACVPEYRAALAWAPDDWLLHANLARVLESSGEAANAEAEWQQVGRLMPHEPDAWFQLGNLACAATRYDEARRCYRETLQRKPDSAEALNGLGLLAAAQGNSAEAFRQFDRALGVNPRFAAARVNRGLLLAKTGRTEAAMAEYRAVIRLDTNNVAARINLGKLLAGQNQRPEAIALYAQALALKPDDPILHHDLGNALAAEGQYREAMTHYTSAVQLQPNFTEARYNLALELARASRLQDALDQFAEVVRQKPGWVPVRFNYGVALAKQQRYAEAVQQFQAAVALDPDYTAARSALERASRMARSGP